MALTKQEKELVVKDFGVSMQDTGSTPVQVALLTKNIHLLTGHCQKHPKDFSTKRGLLKMVCDRRRLLQYLEEKDEKHYKKIIDQLKLRK